MSASLPFISDPDSPLQRRKEQQEAKERQKEVEAQQEEEERCAREVADQTGDPPAKKGTTMPSLPVNPEAPFGGVPTKKASPPQKASPAKKASLRKSGGAPRGNVARRWPTPRPSGDDSTAPEAPLKTLVAAARARNATATATAPMGAPPRSPPKQAQGKRKAATQAPENAEQPPQKTRQGPGRPPARAKEGVKMVLDICGVYTPSPSASGDTRRQTRASSRNCPSPRAAQGEVESPPSGPPPPTWALLPTAAPTGGSVDRGRGTLGQPGAAAIERQRQEKRKAGDADLEAPGMARPPEERPTAAKKRKGVAAQWGVTGRVGGVRSPLAGGAVEVGGGAGPSGHGDAANQRQGGNVERPAEDLEAMDNESQNRGPRIVSHL